MLRILRHIWDDIQRGENVDLYITLAIAIPVVVLSIAGITSQSWIAPLTLAVLTLIAISLLVNRRKMETVQQQYEKSIEAISQQFGQQNQHTFLEAFPESLKRDIEGSQEIWMVGIDLNRTISENYDALKTKIESGGIIKVLLMDPKGKAIALSISRSKRPIIYATEKSKIEESLKSLCALQKIKLENLKIWTIDYPLPFGAIVINPQSSNGSIYWKNYGINMKVFDKAKSIITFKDIKWYNFYIEQIQAMMEYGQKYECKSPKQSISKR